MTSSDSILITGAGQRLGLHCARRLIEDGHSVIFTYRREREGVKELQRLGATGIQADFGSEAGIAAFIETVKARTTRLRAIVHNASDWLEEEPGREAEAFNQLVCVHMLAPYLINLRCAELLEHGGPADIVHISDDVTRKGSARHMAYAASKAGLDNLTLSFAARLAPHVKVNGIAPALIAFRPGDDEAYKARALAKSALRLEPGAEVVYQSLRFLLDNPYLTGTTLPLNGGRHLI